MAGHDRYHSPFGRSRHVSSHYDQRQYVGCDQGLLRCTSPNTVSTDMPPRRGRFSDEPSAHYSNTYEISAELPAEEESVVLPDHIRAASETPSGHAETTFPVGWDILEAAFLPRFQQLSTPTSPPPPYSYDDLSAFDPSVSMIVSNPNGRNMMRDSIPPDGENDSEWTNPILDACQEIIQNNFRTNDPEVGTTEYFNYRRRIEASPNYRWYLNFRYGSLVLHVDLPAQVFLVGLRQRDPALPKQSYDQVLAYLFENSLLFAESLYTGALKDPNAKQGVKIPELLKHGLTLVESWPIRFSKVKQACNKKDLNLIIDVANDDAQGLSGEIRYELKFRTPHQRQEVFSEISAWLEHRATSRQTSSTYHHEREQESHRPSSFRRNESGDRSRTRHRSSQHRQSHSRSQSRSHTKRRASEQPIRRDSSAHYSHRIRHDSSDGESIPKSATMCGRRRSHSPHFFDMTFLQEERDRFSGYPSFDVSSYRGRRISRSRTRH